jgi:hypothetical protein
MEKRLRTLEIVYQRQAAARPAVPVYDFDRLTQVERLELDDLLAKVEGLPRRPNGRPALSPLLDAELERAYELSEKGRVA